MLTEENDDRVEEFLAAHPEFKKAVPDFSVLGGRAAEFQHAVLTTKAGIVMTPKRTGTDGFYFSLLRREG